MRPRLRPELVLAAVTAAAVKDVAPHHPTGLVQAVIVLSVSVNRYRRSKR